jgi:ketosteroid isomerase-like protein
MTITNPTPQTATKTWYEEFYARVDALDVTLADELLTEDSTMTMANHPMDIGRDAVRAGMEHFFTMIKGMHHTFKRVVEDGDFAAIEAICTYTRLDGSTVDIPVFTAIERRDGKVAAQRVYIDLAPLFTSDAH